MLFDARKRQDVQHRSTEKNQDDGVTSKKHLADEPILVHTLSFAALGFFRPHLLHILQHHVAMSIECFDSRQQLAVIPT